MHPAFIFKFVFLLVCTYNSRFFSSYFYKCLLNISQDYRWLAVGLNYLLLFVSALPRLSTLYVASYDKSKHFRRSQGLKKTCFLDTLLTVKCILLSVQYNQ